MIAKGRLRRSAMLGQRELANSAFGAWRTFVPAAAKGRRQPILAVRSGAVPKMPDPFRGRGADIGSTAAKLASNL